MHPNLAMIAAVARRLGVLCDQCVFVGGATVPLFLTDPSAPSPRPTKDVDVIVELASRVRYHAFGEKLRAVGFQEETEAGILCRWKMDEIIVDVMPTDATILGFANCWYPAALETAHHREIEPGLAIRLIAPPYFIATKIEAFLDRGKGDFVGSRDMEDIVTVLDGRSELTFEIAAAPEDLRVSLAKQFAQWLEKDDFLDALSGHLLPDRASQARFPLLLERIKKSSTYK